MAYWPTARPTNSGVDRREPRLNAGTPLSVSPGPIGVLPTMRAGVVCEFRLGVSDEYRCAKRIMQWHAPPAVTPRCRRHPKAGSVERPNNQRQRQVLVAWYSRWSWVISNIGIGSRGQGDERTAPLPSTDHGGGALWLLAVDFVLKPSSNE